MNSENLAIQKKDEVLRFRDIAETIGLRKEEYPIVLTQLTGLSVVEVNDKLLTNLYTNKQVVTAVKELHDQLKLITTMNATRYVLRAMGLSEVQVANTTKEQLRDLNSMLNKSFVDGDLKGSGYINLGLHDKETRRIRTEYLPKVIAYCEKIAAFQRYAQSVNPSAVVKVKLPRDQRIELPVANEELNAKLDAINGKLDRLLALAQAISAPEARMAEAFESNGSFNGRGERLS